MKDQAHLPYSDDDAALDLAIANAKTLAMSAKVRWDSENYVRNNDPGTFDMIGRSIEFALSVLDADEIDLRDNTKAAASSLWRLPLDPSDSETLHKCIEELHAGLLAVEVAASKLDYPASELEPCLIPRGLVAEELDDISGHVAKLDRGLDDLEFAREATRPGEIANDLIQFARASIAERSTAARTLAADLQIDLTGMTNVLESAARQTREFHATISVPSAQVDQGIPAISRALERDASLAAAASLRILKTRARRAHDYIEATRRSARIWLDYAPADAGLMREIAEPLQQAGFKLAIPATSAVDLYDFLAGRSEPGKGPRELTSEEKQLWALVAKTVQNAKPRPLNLVLCVATGSGDKGLAYAQALSASWPRQVVVASSLSSADTRRLREQHRNVVSFRGDEHQHMIASLIDVISAAITGLTRA